LILDDILELGAQATEIHKNLAKKIAKERIIDTVLYV